MLMFFLKQASISGLFGSTPATNVVVVDDAHGFGVLGAQAKKRLARVQASSEGDHFGAFREALSRR